MAKIFNMPTGTIIPQPNFSAAQNENGGWDATQSFRILKGDLDTFGIKVRFPGGATLRSLDPDCDDYFAYLRLATITAVNTIEGGWTEIGVKFVGFAGATSTTDPPLETPVPTYSKRGVLKPAPLYEHPKWKALSATQKFALGLLLKGDAVSSPDFTGVGNYGDDGIWAAWEDDSGAIVLAGDALEFATRIAQGQTTYDLGTYSYSHRWEDNLGVTATQMNLLGKIATPSGSPPKPNATRNWLLTDVNEEQYGSGNFRFTNELVYLLSDEGGHDSFLQS